MPAGLGLYLKLGALALALLLGLGGGCKLQAARDAHRFEAQARDHAAAIAKKNKALTKAAEQLDADARQLRADATALREVDAATKREAQRAAAAQAAGEAAAAQARRDRRLYEQRLAELEVVRERAAADSPQCRAKLEAPLSEPLH